MRILFCGDIVGSSGRKIVTSKLPSIKQKKELDFVIANGENAAGGFGITPTICEQLYESGIDIITTGNHVWDQREIIPYITREDRIIRPINYPDNTPGEGYSVLSDKQGRKILTLNVMGRLFMDPLNDPVIAIQKILKKYKLGENINAIVVDIHGEASSEKMIIGHILDGKVSLVVGTHTHIPTADSQILPKGTAYQTDAGMCGDYDSVIGGNKERWIERFLNKIPTGRIPSAEGEGTLCGTIIETNENTGLAVKIDPIILGKNLKNTPF